MAKVDPRSQLEKLQPGPDALDELLFYELVPAWLLESLAASADEKVRRVVAAAPGLAANLVDKLAQDTDARVRERVAQRSDAPFAQLAGDASTAVRTQVAANPAAPPELLAHLLDDVSGDVLLGAARNPKTPPERLALLADIGLSARLAVANNPTTPVDTLAKLAGDDESDVLAGVISNPRTPVEAMQRVQRALPPAYRWVCVWNRELTLELAAQLHGTPATWRQMIDEAEADLPGLATSVHLPLEYFAELAEHHEWRVRANLAKNPRTPGELIAKLLADSEQSVRRAAFAALPADARTAARTDRVARLAKSRNPFTKAIASLHARGG